MNVQSPVFVPNSSCSSSTGGEISIGSSNTASNGNLLTSSLELNTPLAGMSAWPALVVGSNELDTSITPGGSSGKKVAQQSILKGVRGSDTKKAHE